MKPIILSLCMILTFTVSSSGCVVAKTPKCGEISKRDIKDVFNSAKDVRFYYDVREDFNAICTKLEEFREWESVQDKGKLSNKLYKKHKEDIIDGVRRSIAGMNRSLTVIRVWLKVDPNTKKQKYTRIIKIRDAKKISKFYR
ncbi:MAG: hypothetical protein COB14_05030 [Alphaproteobacteria bacterium]|nr:MAG: hypothetical protein COB14_05030 [Alphaproteobacteria bacterium]